MAPVNNMPPKYNTIGEVRKAYLSGSTWNKERIAKAMGVTAKAVNELEVLPPESYTALCRAYCRVTNLAWPDIVVLCSGEEDFHFGNGRHMADLKQLVHQHYLSRANR